MDPRPSPPPDADTPAPTPESRATGRTRLETLGWRAWAIVGVGVALYGVYLLLGRLAWLVAPAVVALVIGILATPLVNALSTRRRMPRSLAATLVFLLLFGVFGGALWLTLPVAARQINALTAEVPNIASDLSNRLADFQHRVEHTAPAAGKAIGEFRDSLRRRSSRLGNDLAHNIFSLVGTAAGFLVALLLGFVVSFLTVKDMPSLMVSLERFLARPQNVRLRGFAKSARLTVTRFVRHQLGRALLVGILETLLFWLIGLPYFVPLGIVGALGNLVPGVGPPAAGVAVALVALGRGGPALLALTVIVIAIVKFADLVWFRPLLGGRESSLPTLVQIVALVVGAGLLGIGGLLIAIPVAGVVRDLVHWLSLPDESLEEQLAALDRPGVVPGRPRRRGSRHAVDPPGLGGRSRTLRRPEAAASAPGAHVHAPHGAHPLPGVVPGMPAESRPPQG